MRRKMQKTCHQAGAAVVMVILDADKRLRAFEKRCEREFLDGLRGSTRGVSRDFVLCICYRGVSALGFGAKPTEKYFCTICERLSSCSSLVHSTRQLFYEMTAVPGLALNSLKSRLYVFLDDSPYRVDVSLESRWLLALQINPRAAQRVALFLTR